MPIVRRALLAFCIASTRASQFIVSEATFAFQPSRKMKHDDCTFSNFMVERRAPLLPTRQRVVPRVDLAYLFQIFDYSLLLLRSLARCGGQSEVVGDKGKLVSTLENSMQLALPPGNLHLYAACDTAEQQHQQHHRHIGLSLWIT